MKPQNHKIHKPAKLATRILGVGQRTQIYHKPRVTWVYSLQLLFFRTPSDPATNTSEFPGLPAAACLSLPAWKFLVYFTLTSYRIFLE